MKKRIVTALLLGMLATIIIPATAQAETAVAPYQQRHLEMTYWPPGSLGTPFWFYPW